MDDEPVHGIITVTLQYSELGHRYQILASSDDLCYRTGSLATLGITLGERVLKCLRPSILLLVSLILLSNTTVFDPLCMFVTLEPSSSSPIVATI